MIPDVLGLEEIDRPVVGDDDVLIRVHAAGVSYPEGVMTRGVPYIARLFSGVRRPRHGVRGTDVAGTVTEVGAKVADLQAGDEVFGWCGRAADGAASPRGQHSGSRRDRVPCHSAGRRADERERVARRQRSMRTAAIAAERSRP
jgi:NADPH:quinone reductase-like Zn-dependent oxidoreductase